MGCTYDILFQPSTSLALRPVSTLRINNRFLSNSLPLMMKLYVTLTV